MAQADAAGYPVVVKAQVKVGGRGKAGGIKLAADADEVRAPRRQHPGHGHQGPRRPPAVGRARLGHRQGVLRQLHPGPPAKKHLGMLSAKGGVEIEEVAADQPRGHRPAATSTRWSGSTRPTARRWVDEAGLDEEAREQAGRPAGQALPLLRRGRLRPGRDQPADPDPRRAGPRPRRQGDPRRQRRLPPPRVGGVRGDRDRRPARADGQGEGPQLHRPRRVRSASSPTAPAWP